jgi:hypothetical protein
LKEQIEFQKYILISECFDGEEKKEAKVELSDLMQQLKNITH